jgi:2-hydroxychromene-2-carboxylate isomerase
VPGAPAMFVDGEMFWGHDRLPQVERWIATGPF